MGLEEQVRQYWTERAHDFGLVRRNELRDPISGLWVEEMERYLPRDRRLEILDAGTGTGYLALLLAARGHSLTGIDLTPEMLAEGEECAAAMGLRVRFLRMDAQRTDLPAGCFDAVVTRNLTWTLPDPAEAYREWHRLLKPGGVLLNFDADYAENVRRRNQNASRTDEAGVYGHVGMTPELSRRNAELTLSMPASRHARPDWDLELLREAGFIRVSADRAAGRRILGARDLPEAPLFLIHALR